MSETPRSRYESSRRIIETLGTNGQIIAHHLGATHCTAVGTRVESTGESTTAYILHTSTQDFRWIEDNADGVGEDEDHFTVLWNSLIDPKIPRNSSSRPSKPLRLPKSGVKPQR